ncbi:MAG: Tm-1-like ATP-binding domain-containing protein [Acidimicrobiia bacterium]|nr:Tm-1-like ATP-binding domain-containing protein [Acidimicrobiia bacterium]
MATVVLLGTLDTKGGEYAFIRQEVSAAGCDVILVDAGIVGPPRVAADVTADQVARAAGEERAALAAAGDRGVAVAAMAEGAAIVLERLFAEGRLHGVLGLGGSGGSSLFSRAVRGLPLGLPKLLVSTVASGNTRAYVGISDLTLMYSVVDIAGINAISERVLGNAAAAMAGMARHFAGFLPRPGGRPLLAATMFGNTTPCVEAARYRLEEWGYEVLVFHATGSGGMAMESLMEAGLITGVLDVTAAELADDLLGGLGSAGPDRMEVAGRLGLPQVVAPGAIDMVNFGPPESVPERFRSRHLYRHNPAVTLMRTSPGECAELGRIMAEKLNRAAGPLTVFLPLCGFSAIGVEGGVFHDPAADAALVAGLKAGLDPRVEVVEFDTHINDPAFAAAMAARLHEHYQAWARRGRPEQEGSAPEPKEAAQQPVEAIARP